MSKIRSYFLAIVLLSSCSEIKTNEPNETYKYWAGQEPSDGVRILNGQYWQSSHFTKEYIMYLKLMPTKKWWDGFLKQNQISTDVGNWTVPIDAPDWFKPTENSLRYIGNDFDLGSRYFCDQATGICYIYEIQL